MRYPACKSRELEESIRGGMSMRDLKSVYSVTSSFLYGFCFGLNLEISVSNGRPKKLDPKEVQDFKKNGMNNSEIAKKLKVSRSTVIRSQKDDYINPSGTFDDEKDFKITSSKKQDRSKDMSKDMSSIVKQYDFGLDGPMDF